MQTYKYQIPASGRVEDVPVFTATMLKQKLNDGPDCLMAYCIFPSDSDILDTVTIDLDGDNITAVNLHTYTKLWDGMEEDLKDCVQANLAEITSKITIKGEVKALGREGDIPETLYHITERDKLGSIMEKGLIPGQGSNNYKDMENHVYLCDKENLAPWLAILKNVENPVILKVDTERLEGVEAGRVFKDRTYIPDGYSEYRTMKPIPVAVISEANIEELKSTVNEKVVHQLGHAVTSEEREEAKTGLNRLANMGFVEKDTVLEILRMQDMFKGFGDAVAALQEEINSESL